jgi:hypothetical protein
LKPVVQERNADDRRVYASRRRRLLIAGSLIAIYGSTVGLIFEKDPSTGIKPLPGDYLWIVIPGTITLAMLIWRAMKVRIETDARGIDVYHVAGHEAMPWSQIRSLEVHPTPGRQGFAVRARRPDETLVTLRTEISALPLRDRDEARRRARATADRLRDELDADRRTRLATRRSGAAAVN